MEQREGRILRQGNQYDKVHIYRYVTKGTFDAYNWSIIENKQKFISQIMTSGNAVRTCADVDEAVLNYAEMKAIASGNPLIKQKMEVDAKVSRLLLLKRNFTSEKYGLENDIRKILPERIKRLECVIEKIKADIAIRNRSPLYVSNNKEETQETIPFSMTIQGRECTKRKEAGEMVMNFIKTVPPGGEGLLGEYAGFCLSVEKRISLYGEIDMYIRISGNTTYTLHASTESDIGNITRIHNAIQNLEKHLSDYTQRKMDAEAELESSRAEFGKPFPEERELAELLEKQRELTEQLSMPDETEQRKEQKDNSIDVTEAARRRHVSR